MNKETFKAGTSISRSTPKAPSKINTMPNKHTTHTTHTNTRNSNNYYGGIYYYCFCLFLSIIITIIVLIFQYYKNKDI